MVVEGVHGSNGSLPPNGRGGTGSYQPVQVRIAPNLLQQQSLSQCNNSSVIMRGGVSGSSSSSSLPGTLAVTSGNNTGQQVQNCNCCPYGYHIDRDFVRFCESYRTPDGQIYQRTVKSRLVMPWDPPLDNSDPDSAVVEGDEEDVAIEIDGEIAYMHVEKVITESIEDPQRLGEYYSWSPDAPLPVMQKFRTVHESRQEEEGVINLHHTEHATYEMKAPTPPAPPPVETSTKAIETDEVYLRNAGCQAEIIIEKPKRDASTVVWVDRRDTASSACVSVINSGFGGNDVNGKLYQDPPETRSTACGDGAPKQRDFCFGNNRVDKFPYVDPQLRSIGANYDSDAPWIKSHSQASVMAGPSFFRGFSERGLQADLLPKPPKMCTVGTQFDKKWATSDVCVGDGLRNISSIGVQVQPDVSSRTTANPWPDVRPLTYEAASEAAIEADFIEKETCTVNFANSFETILRAIYQHQIVNKEEVLQWLQEALYKDLKTVECQVDTLDLGQLSCGPPPPLKIVKVDTTGCQTLQSGPDCRLASGMYKNHATQVRPKTNDSGSWTDRAITVSASTGTDCIDRCHKQTTTQPAITYTVGTSTECRDDGIEYRQVWSRASSSDDLRPRKSEQKTLTEFSIRSESKPLTRCVEVVSIPVAVESTPAQSSICEPPPQQAPIQRPLPPQLSPAIPRPVKKSDTVKIDIDARIRQFEQQIAASTTTETSERCSSVPPPVGSEDDIPRCNRARPESKPAKPLLHAEVIGIKPAGRDIGLLESAVRYRSSSHIPSSPNRPLKSCLKKSYSELVGPEPSFHDSMGWGSSEEMLSKQPKGRRRISFSDRVQETNVSPAITDEDDDEDDSCSSDDRRRRGMSDSDDSIDEGTYRIESSSSAPRIITSSRHKRGECYSLPQNVMKACEIFAEHLVGKGKRPSSELEPIVATIAGAWFAASSQKAADPQQVEDYMTAFRRISSILMDKITTLCDQNGNTALHYAVSQANFKVVDLLLDCPAVERTVDVLNQAGYSALMLASLAEPQTPEERAILTRLFRAGKVNARSAKTCQTALMLSAAHGRLAVVDLLLACGANPNAQDEDGSTALMVAAEHDYVDVARRLLADPRTDPTLADKEGYTAFKIAIASESQEMADLIGEKVQRWSIKSSYEEEPQTAGSVSIPITRTAGRAAPPQPLTGSNAPAVTVVTTNTAVIPPPTNRIHPRPPMRGTSPVNTTLSTIRTGRRSKSVVTTHSTETTSC